MKNMRIHWLVEKWLRLVLCVNVAVKIALAEDGDRFCNNCVVIGREQLNGTYPNPGEYPNVVPKCCKLNEKLVHNANKTGGHCVTFDANDHALFEPLLYTHNDTGLWRVAYDQLTVIVGSPFCPYGRYPLEPKFNDKDEYYVYESGQLFMPYVKPQFVGVDSFCLEFVGDARDEDGATIAPFLCFDRSAGEKNDKDKYVLYATGLLISVPFLLATFAVYVLVPELNDVHGKSLSCHVICLALAFFTLATVQLAGEKFPQNLCITIAYVIQFFFTTCFCWLNVMCIDTWINVSHYLKMGTTREEAQRHFLYYSIYAWGLPLFLSSCTMFMDMVPIIPSTYIKPQFGLRGCWFNSDEAAFPYFYFPIGVIICVNVVLFVLTAKQLCAAMANAPSVVDIHETDKFESFLDFRRRWRKYKQLFRLCMILCVVMGVNWVMEVISWAIGSEMALWTFFDILNALQGVFIFVIFVLQNPVRNMLVAYVRTRVFNETASDSEMQDISTTNTSYVDTSIILDSYKNANV